MSDKCSLRECPPKSACELLAEAEARKKKREEEKLKMDIFGRRWKVGRDPKDIRSRTNTIYHRMRDRRTAARTLLVL